MDKEKVTNPKHLILHVCGNSRCPIIWCYLFLFQLDWCQFIYRDFNFSYTALEHSEPHHHFIEN